MTQLGDEPPVPSVVPHTGFDGCAEAWKTGWQYIISLRLVGLLLATTTSRWSSRRWRPLVVLGWLLLPAWPLAINCVLALAAPHLAVTRRVGWVWMSSLSLANVLLLAAPNTVWVYVEGRIGAIDNLLATSPRRRQVAAWIGEQIARPIARLFPLVAGVAAGLLLAFEHQAINLHVPVSVASYPSVMWTAALGASGIYWLAKLSALPRRMAKAGNLNVWWYDPGRTPGVRLLVKGFTVPAIFLLAGILVIPILLFASGGILGVGVLRGVLYFFFATGAFLVYRVVIHTFYWVYVIVRESRDLTLTYVARQLPELAPSAITAPDEVADVLELYAHVEARSPFPVSLIAVTTYGAGIVGALAGFLLQLINARKG